MYNFGISYQEQEFLLNKIIKLIVLLQILLKRKENGHKSIKLPINITKLILIKLSCHLATKRKQHFWIFMI